MGAGTVGDPGHREAPGVAHGGVEVDPVVGVGQVLALHDEGPQPLADRRVGHQAGVHRPPGVVLGLQDGHGRPAVLHQSPAEPREPGLGGGRPRGLVAHDHVVVDVGHRPAPLGVGPVRHRAGGDGLEVGHEVPADQRVLEAGEQQQPGCLDGAGGHDHVPGGQEALGAVGADQVDAGGPSPVGPDAGDERLGQQLGPTGGHGPPEHGHRIALGVDRAAEEGAEAAVVAGRAAVVGDAVGGGGGRIGVVAELLGRRHRPGGPEHRRPRRHREGARPGAGEGVGARRCRPRPPTAPPRRSTARARRSRAASRPPRRRAGARTGSAAGSRRAGTGAPCRRRGCPRPPRWTAPSSPRRRRCGRRRPPRSGRCAARPGGRDRGSGGCGT